MLCFCPGWPSAAGPSKFGASSANRRHSWAYSELYFGSSRALSTIYRKYAIKKKLNMTTFGKTFLYNLILPCSLKDLESHNKLLTNSLYKCLTGNLEISTSLLEGFLHELKMRYVKCPAHRPEKCKHLNVSYYRVPKKSNYIYLILVKPSPLWGVEITLEKWNHHKTNFSKMWSFSQKEKQSNPQPPRAW